MKHYVSILVDGDMPIAETLEHFHRSAERVLGAGYEHELFRFPHKAHTWQLYAELDKPERRGEITSLTVNELGALHD